MITNRFKVRALVLSLVFSGTAYTESDIHSVVTSKTESSASTARLTDFCEEKIGRSEITLTKDISFPSSNDFQALLINGNGQTDFRKRDRDLRIPIKDRACEIYLKKGVNRTKAVKLKAGKVLKFGFCKDGVAQTGIETNFTPDEATFLIVKDDPEVHFIKCYQREESGLIYPPKARSIEGSGLRALLSTFTNTPK